MRAPIREFASTPTSLFSNVDKAWSSIMLPFEPSTLSRFDLTTWKQHLKTWNHPFSASPVSLSYPAIRRGVIWIRHLDDRAAVWLAEAFFSSFPEIFAWCRWCGHATTLHSPFLLSTARLSKDHSYPQETLSKTVYRKLRGSRFSDRKRFSLEGKRAMVSNRCRIFLIVLVERGTTDCVHVKTE